METFSVLLALCAGNSPVPGEFPAQRPVTRSFDVFFDLRPNKPLSKQWWGWWFEMPLSPLWRHCNDIISYPLFADADTGIYPHAASQYHAPPKAKRGMAMLSVDKFPYPRKQTMGNEFIPCSSNICDILKRFRSFKIPVITLIWPKSSYKHNVTRSYRSGKKADGGRNRHCDVINDIPLSLYLTLMTSNVRYGSIFHGC